MRCGRGILALRASARGYEKVILSQTSATDAKEMLSVAERLDVVAVEG